MPPLLSKVYPLYHRQNKKARQREEAHTISRKMGRPLKAKTNLSHDVKVRLDDETYEKLCAYCEVTGKERAAVLREGLRIYLDVKAKETGQ